MNNQVPTVLEVRQIEPSVRGIVGPETIDSNGHMTLVQHIEAGGEAVLTMQVDVGIDDDYRNLRNMGMFIAEQRVTYLHELRLGDAFAVHVRVLGRSHNAVHAMCYIVDERRERIATLVEYMFLHVDMVARRTVPIPEDVCAELERWIRASVALSWTAGSRGRLVLRNRVDPRP